MASTKLKIDQHGGVTLAHPSAPLQADYQAKVTSLREDCEAKIAPLQEDYRAKVTSLWGGL